MARRRSDHCHGSDDQQPADIALAHLRRPPEPLLAACRVLARDQPNPGREVPSPAEGLHRRGEAFDGNRRDRAHARHRLQASRGRGLAGLCAQLLPSYNFV